MAVPMILVTVSLILPALSLSGRGMCREQRHDENQSEQAASE